MAKALAAWPYQRPYVFTKCGMVWNDNRDVGYSLKVDSIRREVEGRLRRLRVETIDLYQIHWPADDLPETLEGWQTSAALQTEGKVRCIGASNFFVEVLKAAQQIAPVTSLQPPYSLIRREIEKEVLPHCRKEDIGVIAYSPVASGLLTCAMARERVAQLAATDWRKKNAEFQEPKLTKNLALTERLRQVGARHDRSPGEVAIAWTLRDPVVTGAIVGARNARQVDGIIGAAEFRLTAEEIVEVEAES